MITAESFSVLLESEGRHIAACPRSGHQDERQPSVWLSKKRHPCIYIYLKRWAAKGAEKDVHRKLEKQLLKAT